MAPTTVLKQAGRRIASSLIFAYQPTFRDFAFCISSTDWKKIRLDPHQLIRGKNIRGSWGGGFRPDRDVPMLFKLLQRENISLTPLTRNRYPFLDINKAVADFSAGKIFRPILTMDSELAVI